MQAERAGRVWATKLHEQRGVSGVGAGHEIVASPHTPLLRFHCTASAAFMSHNLSKVLINVMSLQVTYKWLWPLDSELCPISLENSESDGPNILIPVHNTSSTLCHQYDRTRLNFETYMVHTKGLPFFSLLKRPRKFG